MASVYLVQILLPVFDNEGRRVPATAHDLVRRELTGAFGGLTAYTRAPAEGLWTADPRGVARDDIVVYEVMTEGLDRGWWRAYKATLEARFRQEEVVVRAHEVERL